jgi:hypothetical protein
MEEKEVLFHLDPRGKSFDQVLDSLMKLDLVTRSSCKWQQISTGEEFPFLYVTRPFLATLFHGKTVRLGCSHDLILFPEGWGAWDGGLVFEFGDKSGYRHVCV